MTPLLHIRERLGRSRSAVAREVPLEYSHLYRIEMGETRPSPELANKIAKYFKNAVTRDQILFPEDYDLGKKPPSPVGAKKPVRSARSQRA